MGSWWAVASLAVAVASSGCFFFAAPCGPSTWKEPGLPAWLAEHGEEAGFQRFNATGFPPGPKMAAALPDGALLVSADYSKSVGRQMMHFSVDPRGVMLSADGSSKASVASVMGFVNGTLDKVYRGEAAARAELVRELAAAWAEAPRTRDQSPFVALNFTADWDFDGEFGRSSRFTRDSVGSFIAYGGDEGFPPQDNWMFTAYVGSWGLYGQGVDLGVDDLGGVQMGIGARRPADVKDAAREAVPGYDWRFEDFHFGGSCPFV